MRNFDMDKIKGRKLDAARSRLAIPGNEGTPAAVSRRERRTLEQASGLVPFAVKLDGEMVQTTARAGASAPLRAERTGG